MCVLTSYILFDATLSAYQDHILIYQGSSEDSRRFIEDLLKTCNIYNVAKFIFSYLSSCL